MMMSRYVLSIVLVLCVLAGCSKPQTPQEELRQTITQMVTLIDQGKYTEMINDYANDEIKAEVLEYFSKPDSSGSKLEAFAHMLRSTQNQEAHFFENNTLALYDQERLVFTKINGRWKLDN